MTYALSQSLQEAVFATLNAVPALNGLVFDHLPSGALQDALVVIGEDEARDRSDKTARAALHRFTVSVVSTDRGFSSAKTLAMAVCDALEQGQMPQLSRGRIATLQFDRARARRIASGRQTRRIDLRFSALMDDGSTV